MKYFLKPWKHQLEVIEKAALLPGYALFWDMGCLGRDSIISINANGRGLKLTIEELYRKFHRVELDHKERGFKGSIRVRSLKEDHTVGLNRILDVYRSGEKEVYELKVKNHTRLKVTAEHKIFTKRGWVEAQDLKKSDMIACDDLTRHQKKAKRKAVKKPKYNLVTVGAYHPYAHTTTVHGNKRKRIEKHRAIYEMHLNKLPDLEVYQEYTASPSLAASLNFVDPCEWHIHHKDHNHKNNDIKNLQKISPNDHFKLHGNYDNFGHGKIKWRSFESLTYVGEEMTYDICAESPYNSFVANGLVVHNTGKTATAINILRHKYFQVGSILKTLVLCPPVVRENWKREFKMHAAEGVYKQCHVLDGPGTKRIKKFKDLGFWQDAPDQTKSRIFITNYESLQMKELFQLLKQWQPEVIVADESQRLKNFKAKRTKLAIELADKAKYKYILSGTPILNTPMDIWAQFRFLDSGASFDKNFFAFRAKFFIDRNAGMPKQKYFPNWQPIPDLSARFNAKIYRKASRVLKKDCLDLPPIVRKRFEIEMGGEQASMYKQMAKSYVAYLNDKACVASIALTRGLRLQQIASGFFMDDEEKENQFDKNPRMDLLKELVEELTRNHKVIIWSSFKNNHHQISRMLDTIDQKEHCILIGGMTDKARQQSIDDFQTDDTYRVMVANQQAGGVGVNLTAADYMIYYSRNFSLEADLQSEARCHRGGSEIHQSITRIDLVAKDSIDEIILDALARKENLANNILKLRELL